MTSGLLQGHRGARSLRTFGGAPAAAAPPCVLQSGCRTGSGPQGPRPNSRAKYRFANPDAWTCCVAGCHVRRFCGQVLSIPVRARIALRVQPGLHTCDGCVRVQPLPGWLVKSESMQFRLASDARVQLPAIFRRPDEPARPTTRPTAEPTADSSCHSEECAQCRSTGSVRGG